MAKRGNSSETVLVLGATSGIAEAVCHRLAARGCRLILAARNAERRENLATDLRRSHSAAVQTLSFDAFDFDSFADLIDRCWRLAEDRIEGIFLCYGVLPEQQEASVDSELARRTIDVNFTSAVLLLDRIAERMRHQGRGWIAVVASVAGDRGRRSNYLYGATKAALATYLQGLRSALHSAGVHVLTIKPGYVGTKMIDGRKVAASWMVATPERVARDIDRAIRRRRNVLYTPWYWRCVLACARALPERLFKRLSY